MNPEDLAFSSATEQAAMVRAREVSPVELVELYLERIERIDPELNSYVTVIADHALEAARKDEQTVAGGGEDLPPFLGVPISVKDLHLTAGVRTSLGSRSFEEFVPPIDESAWAHLKAAGFIMLGKTNVPEFGIFPWTEPDLHGPCRNPWDIERTAGGSSGGAGAALAAGLCPASHGSDGGGSIRIPASCVGVFGVKPSRGRVSLAPLVGDQMNGLTTQGPLTRTVADGAALLDVMSGYVAGDPYWAPQPKRPFAEEVGRDPGKLKVGLLAESPLGGEVHPDCFAAAQDAANLLEELGHEIVPVDLPLSREFVQQFTQIWLAGLASLPIPDREKTEQKTRDLLAAGDEISAADFLKAVMAVQLLCRQIVAKWGVIDVMLTPTLAKPPLAVGETASLTGPQALAAAGEFAAFTPAFNATGQPAVSVPLFRDDAGLPIGVQLVGGPADEATLFRLSAQLEEARPWRDRRPPLVEQMAAEATGGGA